jgi:predicted membrane-bound spermidine synthase
VARPVLRLAADAFDQLQVGVLFGSFTGVLVLFSLPVTLLGTISPFAIRLAIRNPEEAGRISGRIYAISTLGSFIGTFLPVLVFIPLIGTTWTFILFSEFLLVTAILGLQISEGWGKALKLAWMPLLLAALSIILANRPIKATVGQIYEGESEYNYIQVLEQDGYRLLRLNEGQGVHSIWHPTEMDYQGPWEQFLAAPFFNPFPYELEQMQSMAIVGLAAGTVARQATAVYGEILIDGYEIDPQIIRVGQEYFGMDLPNLTAIPQDGRWGLERSARRYSVIGIDAYRPPYIPWHLTTIEFFQIVHDRLTEDGAMVINVGRSPSDRRLIEDLVSTIRLVFPSIYVMDVPDSFNSMIYATVKPSQITDLYNNLILLYSKPGIHALLLRSLERAVVYMQPTPTKGAVFTDDRAPIEWITNEMVLDYVFFGDLESLSEESTK